MLTITQASVQSQNVAGPISGPEWERQMISTHSGLCRENVTRELVVNSVHTYRLTTLEVCFWDGLISFFHPDVIILPSLKDVSKCVGELPKCQKSSWEKCTQYI